MSVLDGVYEELPYAPYASSMRGSIAKLSAYEKLDNDGLIVKLPCKIGSKVYEVVQHNNRYKIVERTIEGFEVYGYTPTLCIGRCGVTLRVYFSNLGDTFFLTREEAEKRVDEMKSLNED